MKKMLIILLIFILFFMSCSKKISLKSDKSDPNTNVTKFNEDNRINAAEDIKNTSLEITPKEEGSSQYSTPTTKQTKSEASSTEDHTSTTPKDNSSDDLKTSNLSIENIIIEYFINSKRKLKKEYPLGEEESERTIFYGNSFFANIKFSEDISENDIEDKLKSSNKDIYLYACFIAEDQLSVGMCIPDDSNQRDVDFVIPKEISSLYGVNLDEDKIIKLRSVPDVTVDVVSHNEEFPLMNEESFNLYYAQIERNMDYDFSLVFNSAVNKESIDQTLQSVFNKYNTYYFWLSDNELKISLKNIKDSIDGQIDFSTALDGYGNKIYKTIYIAIDPTKSSSSYDLNDVFPNAEGVSWNYINSNKYHLNEEVKSIRYEQDKKVILVNGSIKNKLSNYEFTPNYTKKYTITEDSIDLFHNNSSVPILKTPITPGTTWSHYWYNYIKAETTIIDVTDDIITTETKLFDSSYYIKRIKTIYKMNTGIQEIFYYYSNDEDSPDKTVTLKNIS